MLILIFDIEKSNGCWCHNFIVFLCISITFLNYCDLTHANEKPSLSIISTNKIKSLTEYQQKHQMMTKNQVSATTSSQSQNEIKPTLSSLDKTYERASTIQASEHDIRLEDFFWNGSGDEPLTLSLKSNARLTMNGFLGRETFIKTATVIATVYVGEDSNENEDDSNCNSNDCDNNEIPDIYYPLDQRFWLITSVFGHLSDEEMPLMQEHLANIYRIAFTKQQSIHLGISNGTMDTSNEKQHLNNSLNANDTMPIVDLISNINTSMPILPTSILKYENTFNEPILGQLNATLNTMPQSHIIGSMAPDTFNSSIITKPTIAKSIFNQSETNIHRNKRFLASPFTPALPISMPLQSNTSLIDASSSDKMHTVLKSIIANATSNNRNSNILKSKQMISKTISSKSSKDDRKHNDAIVGRISIVIHNISVIRNMDKDFIDLDSIEIGQSQTQRNISSDASTMTMTADNQTVIIYTVFVNGIPVLATIAASDMKLMSQNEVSKILDKPILTKAEPYLKEQPQATPLIPSSTTISPANHNEPILAMIFQNPYILTFIVALILLIIVLLIILMLVGGSKHQPHQTNRKGVSKSAQTAQQAFLPPLPPPMTSIQQHQHIQNQLIDETRTTSMMMRQKNRQVGTEINSQPDNVDGFKYERDNSFIIIPKSKTKRSHHNKKDGTPTIYFPEPPSSVPSSPSILNLFDRQSITTSSSSTSSNSSSIYYIKKHKSRRHHLYPKQPKSNNNSNQREYATITKKQIERSRKKTNHKRNRLKGGNGNRIGVIELLNEQNATVTAINRNDDTSEAFSGKNSNVYEHIEAFNPVMVAAQKKTHDQFVSMQQTNAGNILTNDAGIECSIEDIQRENVNQLKSAKINVSKHSRNDSNITNENPNLNPNSSKIHQNDSKKCQNDDAKNKIAPNRKSASECHIQNDNESIGSFLSMASIRSFPKCNVPESLNRILEPVGITYLDQYDEIEAIETATAASRVPRIVDTKVKVNLAKPSKPTDTIKARIDDSDTVYLSRTRSDGADPGVIGPVAWQYHKKKLESQDAMKPMKDTTAILNRYEGLIEGAISLYSIETTEYHTIETITKEEFPEAHFRGKSADVIATPITKCYRPFTAISTKIEPEEPMVPPRGAWTNSASPSELGRPMSAESRQNTPSLPNEPNKSSSSSTLHKQ